MSDEIDFASLSLPERAERTTRAAIASGLAVTHGPTWATVEPDAELPPHTKRGADGRLLPLRSLGYQAIKWAQANLRLKGEPLRLTSEQQRFLIWWYAIDEGGGFLYRASTFQRLKGAG